MGTPEVALHMLRLWAQSLGINDPCGIFIAYSASDWDDLCREMLSAYGHGIGPFTSFWRLDGCIATGMGWGLDNPVEILEAEDFRHGFKSAA